MEKERQRETQIDRCINRWMQFYRSTLRDGCTVHMHAHISMRVRADAHASHTSADARMRHTSGQPEVRMYARTSAHGHVRNCTCQMPPNAPLPRTCHFCACRVQRGNFAKVSRDRALTGVPLRAQKAARSRRWRRLGARTRRTRSICLARASGLPASAGAARPPWPEHNIIYYLYICQL